MFKKISKVLLFIIAINFLLVFPYGVRAEGARLFFSPSSGTYNVGKTFTVRVMVDSGGGAGINAAEASVSFEPSMLKITAISNSNTIFKLWTNDPTESLSKIPSFNKAGSLSFGGGLPSTYSGSAGNILSITFSALKVGTASLNFSGAMVLANDGKGTNIFSGATAAKFTITEEEKPKEEPKKETPPVETKIPDIKKEEPAKAPKGILPPTPEITSLTHPDQNKWYANNNPEFSWKLLLDITGVSMMIDDSPIKDPNVESDGIVESKKYEKIADGSHYFHIKLKNQNGWGPITHRKFQVDVTPPVPFNITVNNGNDPTNPTPIINFETKDITSGLEKYQINLDNESADLPPRDFKYEPYKTKVLRPGEHTITIAAFDRALNAASSTRKFIVEPLKSPIITEIPKILSKKENLNIRGTSFYPNTNIVISIVLSKKETETIKIPTDNDGNWSYFRDRTMDKGNYEIFAKLVDNRGAESYDTSRQYLSVVSPNIIDAYGLFIIILLLIVIMLLTIYVLYLKRNIKLKKERLERELAEAKNKTAEIFLALGEEVGELIEFADKKAGISESEKRTRDKIVEALAISEEFITKEIDDVEKEVK
jgi:hypothetical protein